MYFPPLQNHSWQLQCKFIAELIPPAIVRERTRLWAARARRHRYPVGLLRKACSYLGATTGERSWPDVRDNLRY